MWARVKSGQELIIWGKNVVSLWVPVTCWFILFESDVTLKSFLTLACIDIAPYSSLGCQSTLPEGVWLWIYIYIAQRVLFFPSSQPPNQIHFWQFDMVSAVPLDVVPCFWRIMEPSSLFELPWGSSPAASWCFNPLLADCQEHPRPQLGGPTTAGAVDEALFKGVNLAHQKCQHHHSRRFF